MKILVLGGTKFLGRHIVEAALEHKHEITLFNRGITQPNLFPEVEKLQGNRDGDLKVLENRQWESVIDTSGYVPRVVGASAKLLSQSVSHYVFISSISVYANLDRPDMDENAGVGQLKEPGVEEITGETYGPLKALCESEVELHFPGKSLIIRPGLIVGPEDPTDRFTYWPHRIRLGGEVLAPDNPDYPVQFIDVRDLAEWTLRMVESRQTGRFNATGPDYSLGIGKLLEECNRATGNKATFTWLTEKFLLEQEVIPWMELPLWIPVGEEKSKSQAYMNQVSVARAVSNGLTFRPVSETVKATLAWDSTRPAGYEMKAGLKAGKEEMVLKAWHENRAAR
jgi:2'-hydroxyisoflavone reductase